VHDAVGPYFATTSYAYDAGWLPLTALLDGSGRLAERVESTRQALCAIAGSDVEPRVAASTAHLGLAARLLSPPLAAAVLDGVVPQWTPETLWWQPVLGGPMPLASTGHGGITTMSAEGFHDGVVATVLSPLTHAVASTYDVSLQVLWGNVASALVAATKLIRVARPDAPVEPLSAELLTTVPLAGTMDDLGVRRSCCLYYRVPGGGYCGDCVLRYR
jgi:FhuF 2Fe-2S C-terminal domain